MIGEILWVMGVCWIVCGLICAFFVMLYPQTDKDEDYVDRAD